MIKQFSDLAANERTYLAWVRTAVAMMAFGFIIEKFELFLNVIAAQVHFKTNLNAAGLMEATGLAMMIIAVLMLIASTARYLSLRKHILSEQEIHAPSNAIGILMMLCVIIIALFLVVYVGTNFLG